MSILCAIFNNIYCKILLVVPSYLCKESRELFLRALSTGPSELLVFCQFYQKLTCVLKFGHLFSMTKRLKISSSKCMTTGLLPRNFLKCFHYSFLVFLLKAHRLAFNFYLFVILFPNFSLWLKWIHWMCMNDFALK